jgi:hypothetical protein
LIVVTLLRESPLDSNAIAHWLKRFVELLSTAMPMLIGQKRFAELLSTAMPMLIPHQKKTEIEQLIEK